MGNSESAEQLQTPVKLPVKKRGHTEVRKLSTTSTRLGKRSELVKMVTPSRVLKVEAVAGTALLALQRFFRVRQAGFRCHWQMFSLRLAMRPLTKQMLAFVTT